MSLLLSYNLLLCRLSFFHTVAFQLFPSSVQSFCLRFPVEEFLIHAFNLLEEEAVGKHKEHITSICCMITALLHPVAFCFSSPKVTQADAAPWLTLIWLLWPPNQWRCNTCWKKLSLGLSCPTRIAKIEGCFLIIYSSDAMKWLRGFLQSSLQQQR